MRNIIIISDKETEYQKLMQQLLNVGYHAKQICWYTSIDLVPLKISGDNILVFIASLSFNDNRSISTFKELQGRLAATYILLVPQATSFVAGAISLGAQDYLLKDSYTTDELIKTIDCAEARQKSIEAKLEQAEYKNFFNDSPVAMWIFDEETLRFLNVNKAAVERYGYNKEEFLNMTIADIRPASDVKTLYETVNVHKPVGYHDAGRWRHIKKNGEIFYVRIYSHAIIYKNRSARFVIAEDINRKVFIEHKNKALADALQQQKKRYVDILESLTEVVWSIRVDSYELVYINGACNSIFGYSPKEMMADKNIFFNCLHPEDRDIITQSLAVTYTNGKDTSKFRIINKAGDIRYLSATSVYHNGADEEPDTFTGMVIDITEQTLLQEKILNEQQRLSAIINNTNDIIWSIDAQGNIISANQAFYDRVMKISGKNFSEATETDFAKDEVDKWQEFFKRAFEENYKVISEDVVDGRIVYEEISFNQIHDQNGQLTGVSCFSRDITETRKMQLLIQKDKQNLRALIDNTDDLIWSVDADINIISANQAYIAFIEKFVGVKLEMGMNVLWKGVGDNAYHRRKIQYGKALSGIRFTEQEEWFLNDEYLYREISFNPMMDIAGNVIGVSCFSRDVSEHKRQLEKIKSQNEKLREIAWIQSHKVRGPVASILGLANLLNTEDVNDSENKIIINGLVEVVKNLDCIIKEVVEKTYDIENEENKEAD